MMKISLKYILLWKLNYLLLYLLSAGCVLLAAGGCSDDKGEEIEEIPVPLPDYSDKAVYVLFPVNALGDHAYNDLVLKGILEAQKQLGFYVMPYAPADREEGAVMLQLILGIVNHADKGECLAVIAGNEYENEARQWLQGKTLREGFEDDVLLFETNSTDLPIHTFFINMYGASYIAGSIASLFSDRAAILAANALDISIRQNAAGFRDGFTDNGGIAVSACYLSEEHSGYSMQDRAYELTDSLAETNRFIYPIAGGSNQGVYRYSRENPDRLYTAGMDVNLSAYSAHIVFSTVKHIDRAVADHISAWIESEELPALHATYGIASGHTDIALVDEYQSSYKELVEYYRPIVADQEKEQNHEENPE